MVKKVLVAGSLGGLALTAWMFIVNGILGFTSRIDMKQIPGERRVYEVLKQEIVEPGRYACNPEAGEEGFPADEPAYSILYGGMGHGAAGRLMLLHLVLFFLTPTIAAALLSFASNEVLSSYRLKVVFFSLIGLLFALFGDLTAYGIGGYPLPSALLLAAHSVALWTVVGLAVAWRLTPPAGRA